ncbi:MAG: thiolase family protein [Turneriella sp.]|nr:thiolase family protein [Turneriella sp.]
MKVDKEVVIAAPLRTPFAQIGKALAKYPAHHLGKLVAEKMIEKFKFKKEAIDTVVVGEGFANAPNSARVIANLIGLRDEIPAITVANNCVSGMDAIAEATRRIVLGEAQVVLVIGEESQTSMPMIIKGARLDKKTATLEKLKPLLPDKLPDGVELRDTLEDGLGDGENSYGMQATAEILSQNYNLSRAINDKVAFQSFKRAYDASEKGLYKDYIIPMKDEDGEVLDRDEAVVLRKGLVEHPERMGRAMLLFDNPQFKFDQFKEKYGKDLKEIHGPTVSIFNASPRSDGAAGVIVTTPEKAKELGLTPVMKVRGFKMKGVHPNLMGLGQAEATLALLDEVGMKIEDMDYVEIHEAFAATAIGALEEIKKRAGGWDWEKNFDAMKINPNGGSVAIGHPFGATGVRLALNAAMDFANDANAKKVLTTACAHGGVAGAIVFERA